MSLRKTVQTAALAEASRDLTGLVRQVKVVLPQFSDDVVCQVLAEEDENVEMAIENLLTRPEPPKKPGKKKDRSGAAAASSGPDAAATAASSTDVQQKVANGAVARPQTAATNGTKQGKQSQAPAAVQKSPLDQVLEERPKTPSEKEVQKFKKKLREIEAIEERVRSGEKVDTLQLDKTQNKREFQIQLHRAERKAEKEVAELVAQLKKESTEKTWKEAQTPAQAAQPQRASAASAASVSHSAGHSSQHHNDNDWEDDSQDWHQQPAATHGSSVQQNGDGGQRVDQRGGQGAHALPSDHYTQLQQEQLQREQLERELFAVQQMHKEQLRREQQQREELQRQLEMERTQRLATEQEVKARLPHPPGVLPEDVQQARRAERAGGLLTPPTAPPSTAPPTTSAQAQVAQAAPSEPRAPGAGQELLSLLHSSTGASADDASSYEQSANLAKQLGGGVAMGRSRATNEPAKGGKGSMGGNNARPAHGPPSVPPHLQSQGNNRTMGQPRTATQAPQQPPQQEEQKQMPRKRENAWHRWPPASLGSKTAGEGKEEDERDFINFYSTPLVESQFTEEQREAAERIAREIEMNQGQAQPAKSAGWSERGDQSNQSRGKSDNADSTGQEQRGGKGWQQDQKGGGWSSDRRKGGKGSGGKGSKKGGGGKAAHTN